MTTTCECGHERSVHTAIGCAICFNGPLPKHCLGFSAPAADSTLPPDYDLGAIISEAADSRDTAARPPSGTPAVFRYALDNDLAEMREKYSYRSDGDGFWIVLLIDEVESLRAKLAASVPEGTK